MIVFTLIIHRRHGENVSVHTTDVAANIAIKAYVRQNWQSEAIDEPMPDDPGQLVIAYFENVEDEYYEVDQQDVLDEAASAALYPVINPTEPLNNTDGENTD